MKHNRNYGSFWFPLMCLTMSGLCWISVTLPKGEKVIRTDRFELTDKAGNVRAVIAVEPDDSVAFTLMDAKKTQKIRLGVSSEGSGISLQYPPIGEISITAGRQATYMQMLSPTGTANLQTYLTEFQSYLKMSGSYTDHEHPGSLVLLQAGAGAKEADVTIISGKKVRKLSK